MVLRLGEKGLFEKQKEDIVETKIIKAFIKEGAGTPSEEYGEGALVINTNENRLYVQVNGASQQPWAHYKLNETGGTSASDSGSGGNNGTASNANIWNTGGKYGGGIYSTQANAYHIILPSNANWDFGDGDGDFTIMFWFKQISGGNPLDLNVRFLQRNNGVDNYWVICGVSGEPGIIGFVTRVGGAASQTNVKSTFRIDDELWHHICFVHDDSEDSLKLYIDGKMDAEDTTYNQNPDVAGEDIWINGGSLGEECTGGVIDEIKLFNSVRTPSQIINDSLKSAGLVWAYTSLTGA